MTTPTRRAVVATSRGRAADSNSKPTLAFLYTEHSRACEQWNERLKAIKANRNAAVAFRLVNVRGNLDMVHDLHAWCVPTLVFDDHIHPAEVVSGYARPGLIEKYVQRWEAAAAGQVREARAKRKEKAAHD